MISNGHRVNKVPYLRIVIFLPILCLAGLIHAQTKIACVGNSITFGYGLGYQQDYPSRLQALLGTTAYTVQNDGVNATTLLKRGNLPYWTNGKMPQVFSFQPKIVVIKLGTNDTKPENWNTYGIEFKADYLAMVDTFTAMSSKPRIFVVLPAPVFSNPTATSWGIRDTIIKLELPIIKQIALERNLTVIDCNTPLKNFPQYFTVDGVHPSAAGADSIAHIVYRAIMAATSVRKKAPAAHPVAVTAKADAGLLSITVSQAGQLTLTLFDIAGKQVKNESISGPGTRTMSIRNLKSGVYLLRLANNFSRQTYCRRIDIVKTEPHP